MSSLEEMIQKKAYDLGYAKCGIVPVQALEDYSDRLKERMEKVPSSSGFYQKFSRLTKLTEQFPWAKSAIVLVSFLGKYKSPENLRGHIGKAYLFDTRIDTGSKEYVNSIALENYLWELGLKTISNRKFGDIPLRWAAMKAGLGIIRRNNFFYTEDGSWVHLEAWLTDKEMELIETNTLPSCPKGCRRCIEACPSGALSSPYTMNPIRCISFLTTFGNHDLTKDPLRKTFGEWIYGCDACQEACPMNKGKLKEEFEFPGIGELSPHLTPESIMEMEDNYYQQRIQPKFFYLTSHELWKWKINALCYMRNNYQKSYDAYILGACDNEHEKIRELAQQIRSELFEV